MYPRYGLVLTVTHACNLRCSYCYTGPKAARTMPEAVGRRAIERAAASVERGGALELGFFGGEPLLEAGLVRSLLAFAQERSRAADIELLPSLTTNGTVARGEAWEVMAHPELSLTVSFDGLPEVHDRHRRFPDGTGSSGAVLRTIQRLLDAGRAFGTVMVVCPDTLESLADGVAFLREVGVSRVEPSLDLWAHWTARDVARLEAAIGRLADLWRERLADLSVGWLDEKAALLARMPIGPCARCGFGDGEVAVAPSGRLYPCERLIGEDAEANPMRLPGHALEGEDFLGLSGACPGIHVGCVAGASGAGARRGDAGDAMERIAEETQRGRRPAAAATRGDAAASGRRRCRTSSTTLSVASPPPCSSPAARIASVAASRGSLDRLPTPPARRAAPCGECDARAFCNTTCRCSNYVRTGQCGSPDGLLCALNKACLRETARVLSELAASQPTAALVPWTSG